VRVPARARPNMVVLTCAALLLTACTSTVSGAAYSLGGGPLTQPVLNYGYGAQPAGQMPYQPDVVVVAGGPATVRSVSSDGMTWTIDAGAGGASDLAVLTGQVGQPADGRVAADGGVGSVMVVLVDPAR
jgi:hypothetical protein